MSSNGAFRFSPHDLELISKTLGSPTGSCAVLINLVTSLTFHRPRSKSSGWRASRDIQAQGPAPAHIISMVSKCRMLGLHRTAAGHPRRACRIVVTKCQGVISSICMTCSQRGCCGDGARGIVTFRSCHHPRASKHEHDCLIHEYSNQHLC